MRRSARIVAGILIFLFFVFVAERAAHQNAAAHLVRLPDSPSKTLLENREASQAENLRHARYVARHGGGANARWHRLAVRWITEELLETRRAMRPPAPTRIRTSGDACLDVIIGRETGGTWDPTIDFGFGHGNVYEAYGLPGANPGTKMSSAGADWRTNPLTQIRWMRGYVNGRYGSSCAALSFHNRHGWY